jgi:hypothetical protein
MTPEAAILSALNERAEKAVLALSLPALVYREKADALPDEYVMVDHLPNVSTRPMLDSTAQDLTGIYQMTLTRRIGDYEIVYREEAARIADYFMSLPRPSVDGRSVTIMSATVGRGRVDRGTHWAVPVDINFRLDA